MPGRRRSRPADPEDPLLYAQIHRNIGVQLAQRLRAAAWA